jgi:ribosomal protein S19E (S16A)
LTRAAVRPGRFRKQEIEGIHPPLGTQIVRVLTQELELMGYVETVDGITSITPKGNAKLETFRGGLPAEDLEAFERYAGWAKAPCSFYRSCRAGCV